MHAIPQSSEKPGRFSASIALECLRVSREAGSGQDVVSGENSESKEGLEAGGEGVEAIREGVGLQGVQSSGWQQMGKARQVRARLRRLVNLYCTY